MFAHYISLALRGVRQNLALTMLTIVVIGVGIGAWTTTLSLFRAMSADPLPDKSTQLYVPQIDNWGPDAQWPLTVDHLPDQLSYVDATALMATHAAPAQSATYAVSFALTPPNPQLEPFQASGRVVYESFFRMFAVPFQFGGPWTVGDDEGGAPAVVIARALNERLFGGANSVGRIVRLNEEDYRVVGVMDEWTPSPRFYDLKSSHFEKPEQIFVPFRHAIDRHIPSQGDINCKEPTEPGWEGLLRSECVWIQFWVELPSPEQARRYRVFLSSYANEQARSGRFHWAGRTSLRNLREWLDYERVVTDEVRLLVLVSFSFLLVCLINAMALMFAKNTVRIGEFGVRRALGATKPAIFAQCIADAGVIGFAGGLTGLLCTALGLLGLRTILSSRLLELTHINLSNMAIAVGLGTIATVITALYPAWRATQLPPALQLKIR